MGIGAGFDCCCGGSGGCWCAVPPTTIQLDVSGVANFSPAGCPDNCGTVDGTYILTGGTGILPDTCYYSLSTPSESCIEGWFLTIDSAGVLTIKLATGDTIYQTTLSSSAGVNSCSFSNYNVPNVGSDTLCNYGSSTAHITRLA